MAENRLPTAVLAALGLLGASCRGCESTLLACLSPPPEQPDGPLGPCLEPPPVDDPVRACLSPPPDPAMQVCLSYLEEDAPPPEKPSVPTPQTIPEVPTGKRDPFATPTLQPCLEYAGPPDPPVDVCLSARPEPRLHPCLSVVPPRRRDDDVRKCLSRIDLGPVCLSEAPIDDGTPAGDNRAPGRPGALDAVLARGVLPPDLAARLRARLG